ncbi:receptor like protein 42 [Capsella rubella]|uniref:receptor like protein 42 n=1 Tax=Capsella rubella TaxID=81985 RepID=UPI000CD4AAF2|nr:receptor like protein 42 [Capsella rubella]
MITLTKWSLCFIFCLAHSTLVPAKHLCLPDQKDALSEFKNEFYVHDPTGYGEKKTTKWKNNTDCCSWDGVSCDPKTGVVVKLDLHGSFLNGPLRSKSSLFRLQHLQSLYLRSNNLSGILPDSISNLKYLTFLDLGHCNLFGKIPSSLGNLSHLTTLDLSYNHFTGELPDSMGHLNKLEKLCLGRAGLSGNFPYLLLNLSSLMWIELGSNQFKGMLPSNMSSLSKLEVFDVSENAFSGIVPSSLFMISSLVELNLGRNHFNGPLEIGNISSVSKLQNLYIGKNNFSGPIPGFISKLIGLSELSLSSWNTGKGIVDFSIFLHLKSLTVLDLSGIHLNISLTLHFPSPMIMLVLSSCNIDEFPKFLENQTSLMYLDISANQIEGQIPEWLPNSLIVFIASDNQFSGEIPRAICELDNLYTLVLSNNNFSGFIPKCFEMFNSSLLILHLSNNSLSGVIPEEIISDRLISLDVGGNLLSGKLPKSLINCTQLQFLNVEDNIINDKFPSWLSLLPNLQILVLRSNEFYGPIFSPGDSLIFPKLRIFDISDNSFSGVLPSDYFVGWSVMSSVVDIDDIRLVFGILGDNRESYQRSVVMTIKGVERELVGSGYKIYKNFDISGNRLEGDIPESIGLLKELILLNMSNNAFTGHIPPSLPNLRNLQSLDLSKNKLSGKIPPELGKLTFLSLMNFSYNNLEGLIPQGTQIETQNSSSFAGNPGLCGVPLQVTCGGEEEEEETKQEKEQQVFSWMAAALGYVPGVVYGLTIGHILSSYRRDWFMKIFHYFA